MRRRSSRLSSKGYYSPDDLTDCNISDDESLFKVPKKRTGNRRVSRNVTPSSTTTESQSGGLTHPLRTKSEPITWTVKPKQRPISSPPLEKSSHTGHLGPSPNELNQSEVDSSGFSSSEDMHSSSSASTSSNSTMSSNNQVSPRYGNRISNLFFSMTDMDRPGGETALGADVGLRTSSGMKKACVVALPLITLLLLACFFFPLLTYFICNTSATKTLETPKTGPVVPVSAPPQPNATVLNPAVVAEAIRRIRNVEARQARLIQELSSTQKKSSTDPSPAPVQTQLISDLQQAMEKWLTDHIKGIEHPVANKMADFALKTLGATVITTRCSVTYRSRSPYMGLPGFPLWYLTESPQTVIQGNPVLAGKCWPFGGSQGSLVISLSHPIKITHVTLDHLPRYNSPTGTITSAPRDFEVYGLKDDSDEGTHLGTFTYDEHGDPTQTFKILPLACDEVYGAVELRVLSNWGNLEYTCLYRFRVHGKSINP